MSALPIIIVGAGGHAKVLMEALRLQGRRVTGATSTDAAAKGTLFCGVPVLGGDEAWLKFGAKEIELVNGVGSVGDPHPRRQIFDRGKAAGFSFATVIHPSAIIAADAWLGEGAQIMAGAILQPGARVGQNSIINTRASVDHDCQIGAHVHRATLCGNVTVGDLSLVGAGATVVQQVTIGKSCIVGAGSLLRIMVGEGSVVAGVPARPIRELIQK